MIQWLNKKRRSDIGKKVKYLIQWLNKKRRSDIGKKVTEILKKQIINNIYMRRR